MRRSKVICCFIILLAVTASYAELDESMFSFSNLLSGSDLIVVGIVCDTKIESQQYHINFRIENYIKGKSANNLVDIIVPLANGLNIPDEPYLQKDNRYLLFLKYQSQWTVLNRMAGVLNADVETDIHQLFNVYQSNHDIFSKEHSIALQQVFFTTSSSDVRIRLLYDIEKNLDEKDESFLLSLFNSDNKQLKIFSILQSGRLKIHSMRAKIEQLIKMGTDTDIIFHSIVALGDMGNVESRPLIFDFLYDSDPAMRRVAIEAAGKIGGNEIVEPLKNIYPTEQDFVMRLTIITAVCRLADRNVIKGILEYFQTIETNTLVLSVLEREFGKI